MKLGVRDVARYLSVSEETVYRWIRDGDLPCTRVNDQDRISSTELLEWATARGIRVSFDLVSDTNSNWRGPSLCDALRAGGVHRLSEVSDRDAVLRAIVEKLHIADEFDRSTVMEMVLAREHLGSTGVGEGIAIPHVHAPVVVHGTVASIGVFFLEHPIDFQALDGKPIDTVFFLATPTPRAHLYLLGRLSSALHDRPFRHAVKQRAPLERLLDEARRFESTLPLPGDKGPD